MPSYPMGTLQETVACDSLLLAARDGALMSSPMSYRWFFIFYMEGLLPDYSCRRKQSGKFKNLAEILEQNIQ